VTQATTESDVRDWCAIAARAASSKNGTDTIILGVGRLLVITDAFVITSGANARQVRTIAEEVEERVKVAGGPAPLSIEGLDDARWVLMDFGDFVVHIFGEDAREFYDLEHLWGDAEHWAWTDAAGTDAAGTGAADGARQATPAWAGID